MKPRLLFVVNVDTFFLSHRLAVAQAALREGYEVHVAAAIRSPGTLAGHGFVVHPLNIDRRSASPIGACKLLYELYQLFMRVRPQMVHLVTIKPVLLGGIAARLAGVPGVVAAVSGLGFVFIAEGPLASARRLLVSRLYRVALAHPNATVIFQNQDDSALLQKHVGLTPEKIRLIRGSGVDLCEYLPGPAPAGRPVVLLAARLLADKGVREFIGAAKRLRGETDARFVLAGDVDPGNPTSIAREELQEWIGEGVVEWWGHRSDMPQVLRSAHVVVLPSYREGLPKVLIEAAACGLPVVTTDVPGCRDAISPEETGLLVPARDAEALAEAIRKLLQDPERCRQMGAAGRKLAEAAFDVNQVAALHLRIYEDMLRAQPVAANAADITS